MVKWKFAMQLAAIVESTIPSQMKLGMHEVISLGKEIFWQVS